MRLRTIGVAVLAGSLLLLGSSVHTAVAAQRLLTFADLRRVVTVRSPAISPDGMQVAYIRSRINWKADRNDSELVLVDVRTTQSRVLTHDRIGVTDPQWSPDETRIAYVASPALHQPAQVYVLPMNGGDSQRITNAPQGILSYAWRPDSGAIAYTTEDEAPNKKAIAHHLDAVVITDQDYLTQAASQPAHLWLVDASGRKATRLTSGTWSVVNGSQPVWAPDGSKIYYQRQPDPIFAHFVSQTTYAYDVASKTSTDLGLGIDEDPKICGPYHGHFDYITVTTPAGKPAPAGQPQPRDWYDNGTWSHMTGDFTYISWSIGVLKPRHASLYLQNDFVQTAPATAPWTSASGIDRNVHWFSCRPDGPLITASDGVRDSVWFLNERGDSVKVFLGDIDFAPGATVSGGANTFGGAVAFVGLRPDRPAEIYYVPQISQTGQAIPKQLTNENVWISDYAIPRSEAFEWTTDLGTKADGVLTYPVNYVPGRKYPLILDIHGGPVSTSTWDMSGLEGQNLVPVLASRGYFVFRPNYRGSDNLGDAFLQAIVGDVTSGPGRDNLAAVDALRKTGMIDETRIGVSGWSGGGLQTSWLIGHANFWRAAVMGAAVTDWYQQAVLADINENFAQTFFAGILPFTNEGRAKYAAESPLTYVNNVRTPTLILSDTRDQRVPVSQAYMFYHALRDRGVPVQFMAMPRYGHFPTDPVGREQVLKAWAGWFDRWMK